MDFGKLKEQAANAAAIARIATEDAANKTKEIASTVSGKTKAGVDETVKMASEVIVTSSQEFAKHFSESGLIDKIKKVAIAAGITIIYPVLILWKLFLSGDVEAEKKAIIIAALGYFILPMDLIPDMAVAAGGVGYADDAAALMTALKMTLENITTELTTEAKKDLHEWFGDFDEKTLEAINSVIKMGDKTVKLIKK